MEAQGRARARAIEGQEDWWLPNSGRRDVTDSTMLISYTAEDGSKWEIEYRRVDEWGRLPRRMADD